MTEGHPAFRRGFAIDDANDLNPRGQSASYLFRGPKDIHKNGQTQRGVLKNIFNNFRGLFNK